MNTMAVMQQFGPMIAGIELEESIGSPLVFAGLSIGSLLVVVLLSFGEYCLVIRASDDGDSSVKYENCLLYTSPSPRVKRQSRMPSSA